MTPPRAIVKKWATSAAGDDLRASQAEPGQVDGGDFPCCAGSEPTGRELASMVRAEKAEAARDALLSEMRALAIDAAKRRDAELAREYLQRIAAERKEPK